MYLYDLSLHAPPEFDDRRDAGLKLGVALLDRATRPDLVIGLTRGGVPVAAAVSRVLRVPLDIIAVKKIGAPFSSELAIGAVCSDGSRVLRRDFIEELQIPDGYVEETSRKRLEEAKAVEAGYRRGSQAMEVRGKTVALVDDGIATGSTMEAAVLSVRNRGAARVIVAVPVAPPESVRRLSRLADEVFSLLTPEAFFAVGQFYANFNQVSDREVEELVATGSQTPVK
jgi:predicted phosphoribosyltransferase